MPNANDGTPGPPVDRFHQTPDLQGGAPGVDAMHHLQMTAWQGNDEDHPIGGGAPGYRVVYKALRVFPDRDVQLIWPNLRISYAISPVDRGGVGLPNTVAGRQPNVFIVPEWGDRTEGPSGEKGYESRPFQSIDFAAWEESTPGCSHIEVICQLAEVVRGDLSAARREGRNMIVTMKTFLELKFGERLLGAPLVEELGEVFDDWHWNRQLAPDVVAWEPQLAVRIITVDEFAGAVGARYDAAVASTDAERLRFRVACQWYWRADAESDPVVKFIQLWLVIESLEMFQQKLPAVTARLAELVGKSEKLKPFVVELYKVRNALVHGHSATPSTEDLNKVGSVARLLLKGHIGEASGSREADSIREWTSVEHPVA